MYPAPFWRTWEWSNQCRPETSQFPCGRSRWNHNLVRLFPSPCGHEPAYPFARFALPHPGFRCGGSPVTPVLKRLDVICHTVHPLFFPAPSRRLPRVSEISTRDPFGQRAVPPPTRTSSYAWRSLCCSIRSVGRRHCTRNAVVSRAAPGSNDSKRYPLVCDTELIVVDFEWGPRRVVV